MASSGMQTQVRALGKTEANWCAAVESGTGITITSILFHRRVPVADLKQALRALLTLHPRLRSIIVREDNELTFRTPEEADVRLTETDLTGAMALEEEEQEPWHWITEKELNTPFSKGYPVPVFVPKLYLLAPAHSLLVLRVHAAGADMACTVTMLKQIVSSLREMNSARVSSNGEGQEEGILPSIEEGIPPGQAKKPFWAHGVDVVGYGLSSRRHAYLPFDDTESARTSKLIRAALTAEATSLLLRECEKRGVSVHGVITAAALKAIAAYKQVGARGEHYGTTVLLQCRSRLQPPLPDSAIGFYHSALMQTMHTTEPEPFWELATRCSDDLNEAVKNRKHFTDMGDLNALMVQAMRFPNLTPSCSLRTSVLSTMANPVVEDLDEGATAAVGVKDFLSCSSTHGVGPCLALFSFLRHSSLQFSVVYSSPLFTGSLMRSLVDSILFYLSEDDPVEGC